MGTFGAQFTPANPKILAETKISAKTYSYDYSKSKGHQKVLERLSKSAMFLGPKMSLNFIPWDRVKWSTEIQASSIVSI